MIRRPPISTPFPTRRSSDLVDAHDGWLILALPPSELAVHPADGEQSLRHAGHAMMGAMLYLMCDEDRKSTRLNSSHMSISYAVFCLKKKKKIVPQRHTIVAV